MSRLSLAIKLLSGIVERVESGEYDFVGKRGKAWDAFNHIQVHYNIPSDLVWDVLSGNLRVK